MIDQSSPYYLKSGNRLASVDVYMIAQIEFKPCILGWPSVGPADKFKIGYSSNPFTRLEQLKQNCPHNLALFAVIICIDENVAQKTERKVHSTLSDRRCRGEWFTGDAFDCWFSAVKQFSASSVALLPYYTIDLERMTLVPPKRGWWKDERSVGIADWWYWYRDFKMSGTVPDYPGRDDSSS